MRTKVKSVLDLPIPRSGLVGWPWEQKSNPLSETMPDGSRWPRISLVTPSYNQGDFLEATIRSVLLQGYPNVEYIIIDGGSTDGSLEIIKRYDPWLAYWVSEHDRGQSHAINKGIERASGDILLWLNADDICLPGSFQMIARAFAAHPGARLVAGQARLIDQNGQIIGELRSGFPGWEEVVTDPRNSIRQVSTFFDRRLFDELGFLDERLHIAMDTDLIVRFTQKHKPLVLDEYLTAYRVHPAAKTYRQLLKGYQESDQTRQAYLLQKDQRLAYRKKSAANWLSLSESGRFSLRERFLCLHYAVQNNPSVVLARPFWFSLKNMIIQPKTSLLLSYRREPRRFSE